MKPGFKSATKQNKLFSQSVKCTLETRQTCQVAPMYFSLIGSKTASVTVTVTDIFKSNWQKNCFCNCNCKLNRYISA